MSDLVERLRESVRACRAIDRSALLAEAADEIERMRRALARIADENATFRVIGGNMIVDVEPTLTDAEREAIRGSLGWLLWCEQNGHIGDGGRKDIATLRALLERLT